MAHVIAPPKTLPSYAPLILRAPYRIPRNRCHDLWCHGSSPLKHWQVQTHPVPTPSRPVAPVAPPCHPVAPPWHPCRTPVAPPWHPDAPPWYHRGTPVAPRRTPSHPTHPKIAADVIYHPSTFRNRLPFELQCSATTHFKGFVEFIAAEFGKIWRRQSGLICTN